MNVDEIVKLQTRSPKILRTKFRLRVTVPPNDTAVFLKDFPWPFRFSHMVLKRAEPFIGCSLVGLKSLRVGNAESIIGYAPLVMFLSSKPWSLMVPTVAQGAAMRFEFQSHMDKSFRLDIEVHGARPSQAKR